MGWSRRRMLEEEEEVVSEEVAGSDHEVQVTWEGFLPRGSPRVLVVEGDDSTRQIIVALLKKCNYKVATVSDGLKAWEILKQNPQGTDLVLTEVELPSISGFGLLTMIMDHEICKNIPVIMMSSHDSITMVYKCMLKGAADFLVKPIRRNELRNLWQHVWRRHSFMTDSRHAGTSFHQDGNLGKRKHEHMSEKKEDLSGYAPSKNNKCSEKGSDAESSCTRSDMEAESTYRLNQQEHKRTSFSLSKYSRGQNAEDQIQLNGSLPVHEGQTEGKATMLKSEVKPSNGKFMSKEVLIKEERTCASVETSNEDLKPTGSVDNNYNIANDTEEQNNYQDTPLKEAINLIAVMENQPENGYGLRDYTANEGNLSNNLEIVYGKDVICKSSSMPHLELSLRRYQPSSFEEERGEFGTLKHSGSSAFSQYNSRTALPTTMTPMTTPADSEKCLGTSTRVVPDQASCTSSGAPSWYGTAQNMNIRDAMSAGVQFPTQNGKAIKCSPLRVIPLSIPERGVNLDSSSSGYGQLMIPTFYQQSSASPLWNNIPPMWQQVDNKDTSDHPVTKDINSFRSHQSTGLHADQMQEANPDLRDEQAHVSSIEDSGSSNMCNGTINHLNNSAGGNFCNTNNGGSSCNASAEVANEVKKVADICRSSQREAALNKFRMKRKDRCFEKKVRYQSRKKLAEQRPRVKGQFARHVQPDPHPTEV
ncbi:two-component response regulator-like PRR95 [Iris pallida]|uniref:Two-component response regulator-like PRR95 n=1 Tax=Iris pallida TaxID=29817 RepID=A0AAX6HIT3_IRIPA|nr:two-component response regulator-like PRR95 [Iris pallida]